MKKLKNPTILHSVLTTILLGVTVYSAYSLWYVFYGTNSGLDVHLYTGLTGIALGYFLMLFVGEIFKNAKIAFKIIAFVIGNVFFHALIWGLNAKMNPVSEDGEAVVLLAYSIAFIISIVLLTPTFIIKAVRKNRVLNIILTVVYFVTSCCGLYVCSKENIMALEYKKNIQFERITAEEMSVTPSEKQKALDWINASFLSDDAKYPFTFKVDGEEFSTLSWEKRVEKEEKQGTIYRGGDTQYLILTNNEKALTVTVEITNFYGSATAQWKVLIQNNGNKNSGVISDFYALNSSFETGEAELYYSLGSDDAAKDFSLVKKSLKEKPLVFSGGEGRPTETYLPYFNVNGENISFVVAIGWTGQWQSTFSLIDGKANITAKQESFNAYLLSKEEVRSPLVSISFYENANALKGFNLFRNWVTDNVYPENVTQKTYTAMEVAGPLSTKTSDEIIDILNSIDESVYEGIDVFWMDAGWYKYNNDWYDGVGNWTVDETRYDNGIIELSNYAKSKGLGHVLWYEPERVIKDTVFYNKGIENEGWLVVGDDNSLFNLANDDALKYFSEYILNSLKENGVTVYRQDFNFAPLSFWQKADNELYGGRVGICENHYVTNLYKFLDYLVENVDGLIIDNCASGGKRLDLEMTYRSIPFWRSDYNCAMHYDSYEATQSHTYGLSFWLPMSGINLNLTDYSTYALRSSVNPLVLVDFYSPQDEIYNSHVAQRELMTENYYPIEFGSSDLNKIHAMQYSAEDGSRGTAFIFKRPDVRATEYTVRLNGLKSDATYEVENIDQPLKVYTKTGEELMNEGLTISLPNEKAAIFLTYNEKQG